MTTTLRTCPITNEPLLNPAHTIATTALNQTLTQLATLPALATDAANLLHPRNHTHSGGATTVPASRPPLPVGLLDQLDEARDLIIEWAIAFHRHTRHPAPFPHRAPWRHATTLFHHYRDAFQTWDEAPNAVQALTWAIHRLEHLIDQTRPPRIYAGPCPGCGLDLTVAATKLEATCRDCHATVDVTQARTRMLDRARQLPLPALYARMIAELVTGRELKRNTLNQWVRRGRVTPDGQGRFVPDTLIARLDPGRVTA